jgi:hypothetical protein
MTKRSFFIALAAGVMLLGVSGGVAQAGQVTLPSSLASLIGPPPPGGPYAIVGNLEFSTFTYSPTGPPTAAQVTVSAFTSVVGETGITFSGGFFAFTGTIVDYAITYEVTALKGTITDAYLAATGGNFNNGNGSFSISESITTLGGVQLGKTMEVAGPGSGTTASTSWSPGVTSILVTKDIFLFGGSSTPGVTLSVINQGFSGTSVPEPASFALLGIGMTGFLALRRFFKKSSAA